MPTLVALDSARPSVASPNVVARLEDLLQRARDGRILSLAYVVVEPSGSVATGFETTLELKHAHHMTAGTVYLQHRLEENALDG